MSSLFLPVSPLPAFSLMGRTLYWQHLVPFTVLSLYSDVCSVLSPSQCRIPWRIRAHFCLLHSLCKNPTCTKSSSQVRDSALKQFLFPGGHTVLEVPQTHIKQGTEKAEGMHRPEASCGVQSSSSWTYLPSRRNFPCLIYERPPFFSHLWRPQTHTMLVFDYWKTGVVWPLQK